MKRNDDMSENTYTDNKSIIRNINDPDIFYDEISSLLKNTDTAAEIKAAVSAASEGYAASAAYRSSYGYTENENSRNSRSSDLEKIISELNKPIQITLDGKIIGESTMRFERQYKRLTRT